MTPPPGEAERPRREAENDPVAVGLAAVKEELASRPRYDAAVRTACAMPQPVARGDIYLVEPLPWLEGRRRLAVIRSVDADRDVAEMMLAHPWPELATDTDAVIATADSGLPHPLVVECYVRGPVWLLQLRERVGVLAESLMDAMGGAVVDCDRTVEGAFAGAPLAGSTDPRWHFKEDEVLEWRTLTHDCVTALLDGDDSMAIEPEWIDPQTYADASDLNSTPRHRLQLEETVHILSTRRVAVDLRDLDSKALDYDRWVESLGRSSGMAAFAALQPALLSALSQLNSSLLQEAA